MRPNYFTVLGFNKKDGSYTHFTDCSSFQNAERYANYLAKTSQSRAFGGNFDWFEVLDISKKRLLTIFSPSRASAE